MHPCPHLHPHPPVPVHLRIPPQKTQSGAACVRVVVGGWRKSEGQGALAALTNSCPKKRTLAKTKMGSPGHGTDHPPHLRGLQRQEHGAVQRQRALTWRPATAVARRGPGRVAKHGAADQQQRQAGNAACGCGWVGGRVGVGWGGWGAGCGAPIAAQRRRRHPQGAAAWLGPVAGVRWRRRVLAAPPPPAGPSHRPRHGQHPAPHPLAQPQGPVPTPSLAAFFCA